MIEKALVGTRRYWLWVAILLVVIAAGVVAYAHQLVAGLQVTGLSRDVTWGFYIAQLTFLVGVAASAVMVVLPYYLHNFKAFGRITILGEFLAIPAVLMCMLFVLVDMGQPMRVLNLVFHPSPNSPMFWDMTALGGYLVLNIVIAWVTFGAERKGVQPPGWIKPIIILSIPWAISIHTVTAFLYSGLGARPFWLTAVMAPRFLASAFAAGPAILILLCMIVRSVSKFDPGKEAITKLSHIVTYAMVINVFLIAMEIFTALYSGIPEHEHHFAYLFVGVHEHSALVPWMWASSLLALVALGVLLVPSLRNDDGTLVVGCLAVIASLWIDKGMALVVAGFVPSPLGKFTEYAPTFPELVISLGIYAIGALLLTVLYKVAISVREQLQA